MTWKASWQTNQKNFQSASRCPCRDTSTRPVVLESARPLAKGFRVPRPPAGRHARRSRAFPPRKRPRSPARRRTADAKAPLANADQLRLLVESARIRLAYAHDRQFAVSLSGIRTLPHQIEAVYHENAAAAAPALPARRRSRRGQDHHGRLAHQGNEAPRGH